MLSFRKLCLNDIDAAVLIAEEGKASLKKQGVNQWQKGTYPDRKVFLQDVADEIGYVVCDDKEVMAVCAVTFSKEASYSNLTSGSWKTDESLIYATIHRSAVKESARGKGVFGFMVESVKKLSEERNVSSIRIDTHQDNKSMQAALKKSGFEYCCNMILADGDEKGDSRLGFELLF